MEDGNRKAFLERLGKNAEASYTVEAAMLMPIILAVIMALLQICFIYYDRVILREELEYIVLCKTSANESKEVFHPETVGRRFLLSDLTEFELKETSGGIEVNACLVSRRLVPLYFPSGKVEERAFTVKRKKAYAKKKTIISEVLLDGLHVLE